MRKIIKTKILEDGLVEVYTTRGSIQPIKAAPNVQTIGEIDVYHQLLNEHSIIDTRKPDTTDGKSIPGLDKHPIAPAALRGMMSWQKEWMSNIRNMVIGV